MRVLLVAVLLAGCILPGNAPASAPALGIGVTVLDASGAPVEGAQVLWDGGAATTDALGSVRLESAGLLWVTVDAPGHRPVVRPVEAENLTIRLVAGEDAQVWRFMGDAMFARRMPERYDLGTPARVAALFDGIRPWLDDADLSVLNLESPVTDRAPTNPEKEYRFASPPAVADGLSDAGFDVAVLANNHQYDAMAPGLDDTFSHLDAAGLGRAGAGRDEAEAWRPWVAPDGSVAVLGCTTLWGPAEAYSNRADDGRGKGGAAFCEQDAIADAIADAAGLADLVVFQVHGGTMYETEPDARVQEVVWQAQEAGADLVIGHHPHVFGPVTWDDDGLVAWSLGNIAFDSVVEPTWRSGVLSVLVEGGAVVAAYVEPVLLVDYLPVARAGSDRGEASAALAGRSDDTVVQDGVVHVLPP